MRMRKERLWYVRLKGDFYPIGPIKATSATAARRIAKEMGYSPIAEVWETTREDMDYIAQERNRVRNEFQRAGRAVESVMATEM